MPGGITQGMSNDHFQEPRSLLANRLDELWRAAGTPTLDAVAHAALGDRPRSAAKLTGKKISAWKKGTNVPQTFTELGSVVRVLIQKARRLETNNTSHGLLDERQWLRWWTEARKSSPLGPEVKPSALGQVIDEKLDPFDLEVHRAISDENSEFTLALPTYIEREHDRHLRRVVDHAQTHSTLVVLVGGSSTGKTRSCWEAVQRLKGWRLWHPIYPTRPEALLDALDKGIISPQTVLWLNEMQHYLKDPELRLGERIAAGLRELLRDRSHAPVLVLGTLWLEYWDTLTQQPRLDESDSYAQSRELLNGHKIKIPDTFEETDIAGLPDTVKADERIMQALSRPDKRAAQFLAGAFELLSRYESAPAASHALIDAAIDASRFGIGSTLTEAFLKDAAPGYLTDYEWGEVGDDWMTKGLEYTGRSCLGVSGPLTRVRSRSSNPPPREPLYRLADFLEDGGRKSRQFVMPPETFWDAISNRADSPSELLDIAYELHHRGRYRNAARVYLMAAEAGEINGLLYLADCRRRVGDKADAEEVLKIAADRGSLLAHMDLAELRHEAGDTESAKQIFKDILIDHPIDSDDRSSAWWRLVRLCEDTGDIRTARRWLKQAANEGDASAVDQLESHYVKFENTETFTELITAATSLLQSRRALERIHKQMIRLSRANDEGFAWSLQYYEKIIADEERPGRRVDALVMLGRLHGAHGNYGTARAIFQRAINAMEDDYVKGVIPALVELVKLLKKHGDIGAADRLWKYGLELVLQQRLVISGPACVMRLAGAGLAVASPV